MWANVFRFALLCNYSIPATRKIMDEVSEVIMTNKMDRVRPLNGNNTEPHPWKSLPKVTIRTPAARLGWVQQGTVADDYLEDETVVVKDTTIVSLGRGVGRGKSVSVPPSVGRGRGKGVNASVSPAMPPPALSVVFSE